MSERFHDGHATAIRRACRLGVEYPATLLPHGDQTKDQNVAFLVALAFGVDDLDGTVEEEKIIHAAGAKTKSGISKDEIIEMIQQTGYQPVERDTFYREIQHETGADSRTEA